VVAIEMEKEVVSEVEKEASIEVVIEEDTEV
jgi:hypothetical protein